MGLSTGIRFLKPLNLFQLLLDAGDHSARSVTHVSLCSCRPGYSLNPRTLNPRTLNPKPIIGDPRSPEKSLQEDVAIEAAASRRQLYWLPGLKWADP